MAATRYKHHPMVVTTDSSIDRTKTSTSYQGMVHPTGCSLPNSQASWSYDAYAYVATVVKSAFSAFSVSSSWKVIVGSTFSLLAITVAILWPSFLLLFLPPLIARHLLSGLGGRRRRPRIGRGSCSPQYRSQRKGPKEDRRAIPSQN